ncbi:MAG: STAS domain-containing protein [Burkholderiaceae bacterium]
MPAVTDTRPFDAGTSLTAVEAERFIQRALTALAGGVRQVDLGNLAVFDSAALAALLEVLRGAGANRPQFLNPSQNLRKLAGLYGVDTLLFPSD